MTLDEAIKHCEEVAKIKEKQAYEISMTDDNGVYHSEVDKCDKCAKEHRQLAEWLTELKQLREQTRWIPVSERLPEVMNGTNGECSDDVLICVADDEYITISTGFYGYYPRSKSQRGWWSMWAYGCNQLDSKYKVVAWMPLPQPYKAESEVEK